MTPADRFPLTRQTWIDARLDLGDEGRAEINHHVMEVYSLPLQIYFQGTGDRRHAEVEDVIHGFFADRLARPDFFRDWQASGLRLRRWLMNAFAFYLKELRKKRQRRNREEELDVIHTGGETDDIDVRLDRAFARSLVQRALERTESLCTRQGLDRHWGLFLAHYYDDRPYREICTEFEVTSVRAATMVRTVTGKFRRQLREILSRDGATEDELNRELEQLLELTR